MSEISATEDKIAREGVASKERHDSCLEDKPKPRGREDAGGGGGGGPSDSDSDVNSSRDSRGSRHGKALGNVGGGRNGDEDEDGGDGDGVRTEDDFSGDRSSDSANGGLFLDSSHSTPDRPGTKTDNRNQISVFTKLSFLHGPLLYYSFREHPRLLLNFRIPIKHIPQSA